MTELLWFVAGAVAGALALAALVYRWLDRALRR